MTDKPRAAAAAADEPLTTSEQWDHLESTIQPAPRPEPSRGGAPEVPALPELPELEASSTLWDTTASVPPAPEVPGVGGATAEESWQWTSSTATSAGDGPAAVSSVPRLDEDLLPTVTSAVTLESGSDLDATVLPAPQPPSSIATLEESLPSLLGTTTFLGGSASPSLAPASVVAPTADDLPPLDDYSVLTVGGEAAPPPKVPANEVPSKEAPPKEASAKEAVQAPANRDDDFASWVQAPMSNDAAAVEPPREATTAVPASPMDVDARREGDALTAATAESAAPPLPARPASPPRRIPPRRSGNDLYALKRIRFRDHDFRIVMQNANGPCALIAIGTCPWRGKEQCKVSR